MFIAYAIVLMTVASLGIVKAKCPKLDIIYIIRVLFCIVFGYLVYVPVISMLMDIFICTEEAKGTPFFDIDCNKDCWDIEHIFYAVFASSSLSIVIPAAMYLRVKF